MVTEALVLIPCLATPVIFKVPVPLITTAPLVVITPF